MRRRSSKSLSTLAEESAGDKDPIHRPGRISLAEMEQLKERVDRCLANDIEMDLVSTNVCLIPTLPHPFSYKNKKKKGGSKS